MQTAPEKVPTTIMLNRWYSVLLYLWSIFVLFDYNTFLQKLCQLQILAMPEVVSFGGAFSWTAGCGSVKLSWLFQQACGLMVSGLFLTM